MNSNQLREVHNYLVSKKLPIDLQMEVQDHFVSQIADLEREDNLSFNGAFLKVKMKWLPEFISIRKNFLSRKKIPKLLFEIQKARSGQVFRKSILIALGFAVFQILCAYFLQKDVYSILFASFIIILLISPFVLSILYSVQKTLLFRNKGKNVVLNNFINPLTAFVITFIVNQFTDLPTNGLKVIYDFVNFGASAEISTLVFVKCLLSSMFLLIFFNYAFLTLRSNISYLLKINKLNVV